MKVPNESQADQCVKEIANRDSEISVKGKRDSQTPKMTFVSFRSEKNCEQVF